VDECKPLTTGTVTITLSIPNAGVNSDPVASAATKVGTPQRPVAVQIRIRFRVRIPFQIRVRGGPGAPRAVQADPS